MKLRVNALLYQMICQNQKCSLPAGEAICYAKEQYVPLCPGCKQPLTRSQLFTAPMVASQKTIDRVAKSPSAGDSPH